MPEAFRDLKKIHADLNDLFFKHQEALIRFDIREARRLLKNYDLAIQHHTGLEEEWLMPVYEERVKTSPGGDLANFVGEHSKILMVLRRLEEKLARIDSPAETPREFIGLLDDEAHFKKLVGHHDEREEQFLFPELDRVTSDVEKKKLLVKMEGR